MTDGERQESMRDIEALARAFALRLDHLGAPPELIAPALAIVASELGIAAMGAEVWASFVADLAERAARIARDRAMGRVLN
jgi:hypothetical protein